MAGSAKKAIRDSFLKLLNEKPLNQITIRDIVDDCGINRNTFYYYYQDLPELVETIINEEADRMIAQHPSISSLEECLEAILDFAMENRKALLHIYNSVSRSIFEQYQWRICRHTVTAYVDRALAGRRVSERDRQIMIDHMMCMCFGFAMGWLDNGMQEDVQERLHRLCQLKKGDLERMIQRCEAAPGPEENRC